MKALVVTPYYHPKIGGLENYARQLGIALHELQQWEICVVTSNHLCRGSKVEIMDGMRVYRLSTWFKLSNTPLNPLWPLMIRRIIRREQPDLILAHTPVPSMADAAALAAGRTPFVLVYHASTLLKAGNHIFNLVANMYRLYERITFAKAVKIITVSDYVKEQLGSRLAKKTVVVPNAIWAKDIIGRTQPTATNFIFIGSLDKTHAWKGLDEIIKAMDIYRALSGKPFTLTIVGDGNYRQHYEKLAEALGLTDHIRFAGAIVGVAKDTLLAAATALISYPTTANDAFPTVLLEAWAQQVPVIAAAIGPIPSLIHDRQDGFLAEPKNAQALAAKLHEVASMPKLERQNIAQTAASRTRQSYTWERQAQAVNTIAEGML